MRIPVNTKPERAIAKDNPLLAAWQKYGEPHLMMNRIREIIATTAEPGRVRYTVKKFDPMASVRAMRWREHATTRWAWAIPNEEALQTIAKYAPIVEIGAGTGYWAMLLRRDYGVDIRCYDKLPPGNGRRNHWGHTRAIAPVLKGGPRKAKQFSDHTLFLCWPPYVADKGRSWATSSNTRDMALDSLRHYRGDTVIYIGEHGSGTNASEAFFEELDAKWKLVETVRIPQWDGLHDYLTVWKRK